MNIREYREDMVGFNREVMREHLQNLTGKKEELEVEKIYRRYAHLFDRDAISFLEKYHNKKNTRQSRYLREFCVSGYIARELAPYQDRIGTTEAKSVVRYEKEEIPYRYASVVITNEPDRKRRKGIFDAREAVIRKEINPLYHRSWAKAHALAKGLGFRDYRAMCESLSGIDLNKVKNATQRILSRTSKAYCDLMENALEQEKIGVPLKEAEKHDIARVFRAVKFDPAFPKERMLSSFYRTLKWMGIDLDAQKNVILDIEERPKKTPRAFCMPVNPPEEVYLVTMPHGGYDDYMALFHEGGHTEHFANARKTLDPEFKYLGDNSVTESYAMLLEYLLTNPRWLKEVLSLENRVLEDFLCYERMHKIYFLRRYSAKLRYELQLHTRGVKGMGKVYRRELEKALTFRHPENHYLIDVDSEFYAARYLRAWMLERQITLYLTERFGDEWFMNERAGRFLRTLWSYGQKFNGDEIAEKLGFTGIDPAPLTDELTSSI